jgi:Uma2 family endonuclease
MYNGSGRADFPNGIDSMSTARAKHRTAPVASGATALNLTRFVPLLRIPARVATLAGFRAWATSDDFPEKLKASYIGGEIWIDMSPEELHTHVVVKYEVAHRLLGLIEDLDTGTFYGDGTLVTNEAADLSGEPDGTFVTFEAIRSGRVRLVPREGSPGHYLEIVGTPDWVMEVVSENSVKKDTEVLRDSYYRAGISEYWLIDARGEDIVFSILIRRRGGYAAAPRKGDWQRSRVFGREFRLAREHDAVGHWKYRLLSR